MLTYSGKQAMWFPNKLTFSFGWRGELSCLITGWEPEVTLEEKRETRDETFKNYARRDSRNWWREEREWHDYPRKDELVGFYVNEAGNSC